MAVNKETRIFKSNTLEDFRQKSNEISLHLGDNDLLNTNIADKTFDFVNVSAGSVLFQGADDNSKTVKCELKPEESLDNTGGYIIFKDLSSITGFDVDDTITQSGGFSGTVEAKIGTEKLLVKSTSGTFNVGQDLSDGTNTIAHAKIVRIIGEAFNVGVVRVYNGATELSQNLLRGGFHVVSVAGSVPLTGSPDVSDVVEGTVLNQSNGFSGTVLKATSTLLLFKNVTNAGSFSASANLRYSTTEEGNTVNASAIAAANHGALTQIDPAFGNAIELNTGASANDDIKIKAMDLVGAINELQDDVGITENLTTSSGNLVGAINEHDAELGTISASAMATTASTVSGAIREHEDQIGNVNINSIASGNNTITGALSQLHTEVGSLSLNTGASDLTAAVNELEADLFNAEGGTKRTLGSLLTTDQTSIVDAINELHTELFSSGVSFTGLSADDFKAAVLELRTELGDHTALGTDATASAVVAINELEAALRGSNTNYTVTAGSNIRDGLNAVYADIHTAGSVTLNTDANFLVGGINELETALRGTVGNYTITDNLPSDFTYTVNNGVVTALNTLTGFVGDTSIANIGSTDTVTGALQKLHSEIGDITAINASFANDGNLVVALNELQTEVGANTYPSGGPADAANPNNLTSAINAIDAEIGDTSYTGADITTAVSTAQTNIGTIGSLNTSATNLVGAINEHETQINSNDTDIANLMTLIDGASTVDSSISFGGAVAATNIKAAISELDSEKVALTSGSQQNINSEIQFTGDINFVDGGTNADTFTFGSGTVLDVSNASLLLPGNSSNVNIFSTSFLEVDGNTVNGAPMGFSVDRQHVTHITDTSDVRIQWNESHAESKAARGWQLKGLDDSEASNTADIVTFYNAKELFNIESTPSGYDFSSDKGIKAYWDATNQKLGLDVNDPTVQLSGDVTGSATMTNLGSININTTIAANSVALGSDTTGNYVTSVSGTANEIEVSGNTGEVRSITVGLPNAVDIVDLDVTATTDSSSQTTGALTVAGGAGIAKNLYVGGNLVVQGTQTTLNTETLTVEDTLVLAGNNLSSEPSSGGFGLEVGPITNPSGVAAGVTGAHSIVYNYATDQWEADGSLILSNATNTPPTIESNQFGAGKNLDFIAGAGISVATTTSGNDIDVTITNTLDGYSGWFLSVQGTNQGNIADDERVDFFGGTALTAVHSSTNTNRVTFNHDNEGQTAFNAAPNSDGIYGVTGTEEGTYIKSISINAQGHVVGVTSDDFDDRYVNENQANSIDSDMYVDGSIDRVHLAADVIDGTKLANNAVNSEHYTDGSIDRVHLAADIVDGTKIADESIDSEHYVDGSIDGAHIANDQVGLNHLVHATGHHVLQFSATGAPETGLVATANIADLNVTRAKIDNDAINGTKIADNSIDSEHYADLSIDTGHIADNQVTYAKMQPVGTANRVLGSTTANGTITEVQVARAMIAADAIDGTKIADDAINSEHYADGSIDRIHLAADVVDGTKIADDAINSEHYADLSIDTIHIADNQITLAKMEHGGDHHVLQYSSTGVPERGLIGTDNISAAAVTFAKVEEVATNRILGRVSANTGTIEELTVAQVQTLLNVDDGATATAAANNATITLSGTGIKIGAAANTSDTSASFTTDQASAETIHIVNDDKGSSQAIYKNVAADSGGTATANINNDTLTISGGTNCSTTRTNDTITINAATQSDNNFTTTLKNKLDGIESSANNYTLAFETDSGGGSQASVSNSQSLTISGGTGITVTNSGGTRLITVTNDAPDTGTPAILSNGSTPSLNSGITAAEIRSLIGAGTGNGNGNVSSGSNVSFNTINVDATTASTSKTTGALIVDGGVGVAGAINAGADIVAFASSDERLKDNIKPIENALDKVGQLKGYEFDWNDKQDLHTGHDVGVLAQEVEEVLPEIVDTRDDGYKAVKYEKLTALLINAVNELKDENKELRAEIEALKNINS